jgi:hypothetical protein
MQKQKPVEVATLKIDDYLLVKVNGRFSFDEAKRVFTTALQSLIQFGVKKLFIDVSSVIGPITTVERFEVGKFAAEKTQEFYSKGLPPIKIAYYGHSPFVDTERFGEIVGSNRGLNLRVTTDINEAYQFLGIKEPVVV